MADKSSELRLSTRRELDQTLEQLEALWDDIGITKEQRDDRIQHFYGHVVTLCEKIIDDEMALKSRIINRIERNTRDILHMCEELHIDPEDSVEGLTLLELDEVLQERVDKLECTRDERKEALKALQEKDEGLCELLGETPYYIYPGLVPSPADLKAVQDHIDAMEDQKIEREATYHKLKNGVLEFLATLEHTPDDSFIQELICASSQDDIPLSKNYLHQLRSVHSDLEFRICENETRSLALREEVASLWVLLDIPHDHQQAFLATAPNHTPSHIAKVEEELERLHVLRGQNLERFMVRVRAEVEEWWEKCYVDPAARKRLTELYEGEATEDSLAAYEAEISKWKTYHSENSEILSVFVNFMNLYKHMLELEERAKDPSRLFNTRGGALLQEEKAKRKVKNELPRMEERLREVAGEWANRKGREFEVYGQPILEYIDDLWNSHDQRKEVEKTKRHQAKEGKRGGVTGGPGGSVIPPTIRTPGPVPSSARKRGREVDEPTSTKKARQGGAALRKSPSKRALQKSPFKTPRGKPLSECNALLPQPPPSPPVTSTSVEASLHSTISYDKFEAGLGARRGEEIIHSSFLEGKDGPVVPPQQSPMDHMSEKRLRDALHLASPCKAVRVANVLKCYRPNAGSPQPAPPARPKAALRRTTSQPCLITGQVPAEGPSTVSPRYYGNPRFFRHRDHPLRFLI